MKKISPLSRLLLALASLSLVATYFLPIWQIDLDAPQYPEGLSMQIWLNKLSGQVEIINGLNHYIGMKHIKAEMFPEFTYLVYIVGVFITLGLLVAALGHLKFLFAYVMLLLAGGVAAMVDFYLWGYDYGHNLDPTAAIQIPGFSYQPPLIGHKQLLNFDAYSYPAPGGWVIVVAGLVFVGVLIKEWSRSRKTQVSVALQNLAIKKNSYAALLLFAFSIGGCKTGPQAINIGKDGCHFCKMTIMTIQYGGEIITKKGKVYKFDDVHCIKGFLKSGEVKEPDIAQTLTTDYQQAGNFIEVQQADFVQGGSVHSPMNSNAAAFSGTEAATAANKQFGGNIVSWSELQ